MIKSKITIFTSNLCKEITQTQAGIPRGLGSYVTTVTCPPLFEQAWEDYNKANTDNSKSLNIVMIHDRTFCTWLLANMAASTTINRIFFTKQAWLLSQSRKRKKTEMKHKYMHGLLQAASIAECLERSWWKENNATGCHICQKSSEAFHLAIRMLEIRE